MSGKNFDIDTESLKKEIKQELLKREILMGLGDDEIDLLELFGVLSKRWRLLVFIPFIVTSLVAIYSLTIPNQFKSSGTIFVHGEGSGLQAALRNSFGIGFLGGIGENSSGEYLPALLNSRTMKKSIISQFGLATSTILFGDPLPVDLNLDMVLEKVSEITSVTKIKDGLILVSVETVSATFSAELVKGYLENLAVLAKGPAREKRAFIDSQLKKISVDLEKAELALKSFQDEKHVISLDIRASALVERLADLEAKQIESDISLKESQSLLRELADLSGSEKLEGKRISERARQEALAKAISETEGNLVQLPELSLRFARLKRDLVVKEKVFSLLTEQLELARIAEAQEESTYDIVDLPDSPDLKSKPRRELMIVFSGVTAGMVAIFLAFILEFVNKRRKAEATKSSNIA